MQKPVATPRKSDALQRHPRPRDGSPQFPCGPRSPTIGYCYLPWPRRGFSPQLAFTAAPARVWSSQSPRPSRQGGYSGPLLSPSLAGVSPPAPLPMGRGRCPRALAVTLRSSHSPFTAEVPRSLGPGFLAHPKPRAELQVCYGPDGLSLLPRGPAGTRPRHLPSVHTLHLSSRPSRDPSFLPAPLALTRSRRPSRPQPLLPDGAPTRPGCGRGGGGGGLGLYRGAGGGPAQPGLGLARQPRSRSEP